MENQQDQQNNHPTQQKRRINIKLVAVSAVALLIVLIFLSSSIYNHNLPTVTAAMPSRGHLNQTELTTGIVQYADTIELAADIAGTVAAVLVREGEAVTAGQSMIEMDFRGADDDIHQRISDANAHFDEQMENIRISRSRHQVDLERMASNINNVQRQIGDLRLDLNRNDPISDFEIRQTLADIERTEADLERTQALFDAGIATRQEVQNIETQLDSQHSRLTHLQQTFQNQSTDRTENLERQIQNLEHQLNTLRQDQQTRRLDLEALSLQETTLRRERDSRVEDYQSHLDAFSQNTILSAPADGIVTHLPINQGQYVNANQRLAALGQNLIVKAEIPLSNTFVTVGSEAVLYNASHTLDGVVTVINPQEHAKRLTIEFEPASAAVVAAGETFTIQFEERSSESFVLVPNGAVNRDGDGYFLNQIRRRQGILGTEYYTQRLRVYIGDADAENTVVIRGITFFEPIVIASDRSFSERETIRLRNESDFFDV